MLKNRLFVKKTALFIFLILFSSAFSFPLFAYTLEELNQALCNNNPELLKLSEEYKRSQLDVKDSYGSLEPSIDMQLSGTYMNEPMIGPITVDMKDLMGSNPMLSSMFANAEPVTVFEGTGKTNFNLQFSLVQPIFTWGKLTNSVKIYKEVSQIKMTQLLSQQEQLLVELETRIITLSYLKNMNDILEQEKEYAARLVSVSESAEKSGMLIHQDVVDARIQAKEPEIVQMDLQEQISNQLFEIEKLTGLKNLTLNDIDYTVDENRFDTVMNMDRAVAEEKALSENQLSIQMLNQLQKVNELSTKIAKESLYWKPDIALQATAGYGGSDFLFVDSGWKDKDKSSFNISIGIKTTIWDGGKKLRDVARKQSEERSAELDKIDAKDTIRQTLNSQWNTIDVCSLKIEYQDLKIESAQSKIQQQETIFNTGYGSESDVLTAKINYCNEQLEKIQQQLSKAAACLMVEYLVK